MAAQIHETFRKDLFGCAGGAVCDELGDTVEAVFLAQVVLALGQAVGVEKEALALPQREALNRETRITKHAQWHTGCREWRHAVCAQMQDGRMPGTDKLDGAVAGGTPDDERGIVTSQCALAEDAIGGLDHALKREIRAGEAAKGSVQMAHEHGSRHTFAGNVAEEKEQAGWGCNEVAVVATDRARRLVVVADVPSGSSNILSRKQRALDISGQRQVIFQGALFILAEAGEAHSAERICKESLGINRALAGFADAEITVVHAGQGCIHIGKQPVERRVAAGAVDGRLKPFAAFFELRTEIGVFSGSHGSSCCMLQPGS